MNKFIVTEKAQRPSRMDGTCFYCGKNIGEEHNFDCVLINKKVKIRTIIEHIIDEPAFWNKDDIEFHKNESSWCKSNIIDELVELRDNMKCICDAVQIEYICDVSEPFLKED